MFFFILHLFYSSSHIVLTGYVLLYICIWFLTKIYFSGIWFMLSDGKNSNSMYAYKLISADFKEDTIKNDKNNACFCSF
jgi:hypothetical protein